MKIETLLANLAQHSCINDPYGSTHLPIHSTATFDMKRQTSEGMVYDYSRTDNPTRNALESIFAKAENGAGCVCTNTGIAAISLLIETVLKTGDHILVERDCYGGTYRLLNILLEKNKIHTVYADFTDEQEIENVLQNYPVRLVLCESPTNPSLKVIDLSSVGKLCKKYSVLFAVDNSMATFAAQKPLELGADFSVFSTTKFISGHGSVTAGALVSKTEEWHTKMHYHANAYGRAQSPMDVFLTSLGLPTLVYRMKAQEESAIRISEFLNTVPAVRKLRFPALKDFEQHDLVQRQMKVVPSVLTVELESEKKADRLLAKTRLFGKKVSFGTADSRIELPAQMSHATNTVECLSAKGISNATVRISVGLENTEDLIADLQQALA